MEYTEIIRKRRSIYDLGDKIDFSNEELKYFFEDILNFSPSSMNSQSTKIILLLDDESKKFWEKIKENENAKLRPERYKGFHGAKGTVLFFIDMDIVNKLQEKFPSLKENIRLWAYESSSVIYTNIWNGLMSMGLGANIQHYSAFVEDYVREKYKVAENLKLVAQMPFGKILSTEEEKEKTPMEDLFKMYGGQKG